MLLQLVLLRQLSSGLLKTSFWPDGGRGEAAPEALRDIAPGTPFGDLAPPGPKRAGARCTLHAAPPLYIYRP
jgi:hypothetical protein